MTLDDAIFSATFGLLSANGPTLITMESTLLFLSLLITRVVQVSVADKVAVFDLGKLLAGTLLRAALGTWRAELGSTLTSGVLIGNYGDLALIIVNFNHSLSVLT